MSSEMVRKIIGVIGLTLALLVLSIPDKAYAPAPIIKTVSEYNNQKYLDYLGPEPEPFEVTYVEVVEEPEFSKDDIDLMARVVMSEASILPIDGKQAVAATILNRYRSAEFPDTISGVIYAPGQFSTQDNGEPNEDCYTAVYAAIKYDCFPKNMYYFRRGHYHWWAHDYCQIGNTYFSTEGEN